MELLIETPFQKCFKNKKGIQLLTTKSINCIFPQNTICAIKNDI